MNFCDLEHLSMFKPPWVSKKIDRLIQHPQCTHLKFNSKSPWKYTIPLPERIVFQAWFFRGNFAVKHPECIPLTPPFNTFGDSPILPPFDLKFAGIRKLEELDRDCQIFGGISCRFGGGGRVLETGLGLLAIFVGGKLFKNRQSGSEKAGVDDFWMCYPLRVREWNFELCSFGDQLDLLWFILWWGIVDL